MSMLPPSFMPAGLPTLSSDRDVLEYRAVEGIGFHDANDGVLYYYDAPLVYAAWFQGQLVVATILDEDSEQRGDRAKGWKQSLLLTVDLPFLIRVYESELPFRALYERPGMRTWFVHEDWKKVADHEWIHHYRVFADVPVPEDAKPLPGVFLDYSKSAEGI